MTVTADTRHTAAQCAAFRNLDHTHGTGTDSPLHHDQRCTAAEHVDPDTVAARARIRSNHRPQWERSLMDLPPAARKDFEHYVTGEDVHTPRFVSHRGEWYDTHEFEAVPGRMGGTPLPHPWIAWQTQSVWDAVVLYYTHDDQAVVGHMDW